jgi:hypothetical protein
MTHAPGVLALLEAAARELDARKLVDQWLADRPRTLRVGNGLIGVYEGDHLVAIGTDHQMVARALGLLP